MGEPSESQIPRAYFASGSEEELVVVHHEGDLLTTQESDQRSTPVQSSSGRARAMEDTEHFVRR